MVKVIVLLKPEFGVKYWGSVAVFIVTTTKLLSVDMLPCLLIRGPLMICVLEDRSLRVPWVPETKGVRPLLTATVLGS